MSGTSHYAVQVSGPVRVGVVQFAMKRMESIEAFQEEIRFLIRTVAGYQADFVIFPEYVNGALMAPFDSYGPAAAIRYLAEMTPAMVDFFRALAVEHRINVITGSMPMVEDGRLRNVVWLCRRDGTVDFQEKLHATPSEVSEWGMEGGRELKSFDTDCGRIGMLICYDVEFPELGRLLADDGVQLLFVPFCTDSSAGYQRVRLCAQARAVENECYVILSGCVGVLRGVSNLEIQVARSGVFSPSDYAFPMNGIVTEAETGGEAVLIADLDLAKLSTLHESGSVRNLKQRRRELFEVRRVR